MAIVIVEALALVIIVFGTIDAFVNNLRLIFIDIIETSVTTNRDAIGRIAAVKE